MEGLVEVFTGLNNSINMCTSHRWKVCLKATNSFAIDTFTSAE